MDCVSFISSDFARSQYSTGSTNAHGDVGESFSCILTKTGCDVRKIHSTQNNSCPSWNTNIFLSLHNMHSIEPAHQDLLFTKCCCLDASCQISQESEYVCWCIGRAIQSCVENWALTAAQSMALNFQREWLTDPPPALIQRKDMQDLYIAIYVKMKGLKSVK